LRKNFQYDRLSPDPACRGQSLMKRYGIPAVVAVVAAVLLSGCPSIWSSKTAKEEPSPEQLFEDAEKKFKNESYSKAIEIYERLKSAHPNFEKMPQVQMRIADSFFKNGKYENAASEYTRFSVLYPKDDDVPRAKYQVAMCYFKQMKRVDLDNSMVRRATEIFKKVKDDYKDSKWGKEAATKYVECRKKLAAKEFYKAKAYYNIKRYRSARKAANRVLEQYPKLGFDKQAKALVKKAEAKE